MSNYSMHSPAMHGCIIHDNICINKNQYVHTWVGCFTYHEYNSINLHFTRLFHTEKLRLDHLQIKTCLEIFVREKN